MSYTDQDFEQTAASHTSGPWRVYNPSRSGHYSSARVTSEADGHDVAALIPNGKNSERYEANLRLIAAAPDLLAALRTAHDRLASVIEADTDDGKPEDEAMIHAWRKAREAITKATGQ